MYTSQELEIKIQFLNEASHYLNTLEEVLLEIKANCRIEAEKMNAALRAIHSIKGAAGMMGFRTLTDLVHRLEDSFQVLKSRRNSLELDLDLHSLLLSGIDWLRHVVELLSTGSLLDEQWLATLCYPVFEELYERLGNPIPEDAMSMLYEEKVDTVEGAGTTFTLSLPFTLSVARVVLVESNGMLLAFPIDAVEEFFLLQNELVFSVAGREVLNWQGTMLPLVRLGRYLEFNCQRYDNLNLETLPVMNASSVLIIKNGNQSVAVQLDRCWGEEEVPICKVEGSISLPAGFDNCTILGDGRVLPLVNASELLNWIISL